MTDEQQSTVPTPYPDVNHIVQRLLRDMVAILQDTFVGMYLYGSLAAGDYDPASSDIDVLVVYRLDKWQSP